MGGQRQARLPHDPLNSSFLLSVLSFQSFVALGCVQGKLFVVCLTLVTVTGVYGPGLFIVCLMLVTVTAKKPEGPSQLVPVVAQEKQATTRDTRARIPRKVCLASLFPKLTVQMVGSSS